MKKIIMVAVMVFMYMSMTAQVIISDSFDHEPIPGNGSLESMQSLSYTGEEANQYVPVSGIAFPLIFAAGYFAVKSRKERQDKNYVALND